MSALQDWRDTFQLLVTEMQRIVIARTPFVRDGKLDLSSPNKVGTLPPANGGTGTTAGVTIRGATDYDNTTAPTTGQAVIWNGTKYHPATPPTGITTLAGLSDVAISSPQDGDTLVYLTSDNKWHNSRPARTLTLNGDALTLDGETLTLGV